MASIMITGGAGFIGSNFAHYWLEKYPEDKVVVLDALTYAGNLDNLADLDPARCEFVHGNIADTSLVEYLLKTHGIRTIVNFAAESHVDRSISDPDIFIETNIVGTYNLLKAAKHVWLDGKDTGPHRFHHVSTDEVYGTLALHLPRGTGRSRRPTSIFRTPRTPHRRHRQITSCARSTAPTGSM